MVTETEDFPSAVLVRAGEPTEGIDRMKTRFAEPNNNKLTNGPGKLCKALGLTREENGLDLVKSNLYLEDRSYQPTKIETSLRIGIKKGVEKKWRFFEAASPYVSVRMPANS